MKLALVTALLLAAGAVSAQPSFPRIDPGVQAARDTDRHTILLQERAEEVKALEAAEKALASAAPGERDKAKATADRHRKNLTALDAEIRSVSGAAPAAVKAAGPVRLKAASAAPVQAAASPEVPFWDVYRRKQAD